MSSDNVGSDIEQLSLTARLDKKQVVPTARSDRHLVCPDCGNRIGGSRGGHELPDGRRVHGWACNDCHNVFPAVCDAVASTWNDRIAGIEVEFRDGETQFVAGFRTEAIVS